jgi:hypothetical protein
MQMLGGADSLQAGRQQYFLSELSMPRMQMY